MKRRTRFLVASALMMLLPRLALAGDVKIVANPSLKADSISASELKSIFLQEKSSLGDGAHVEPVLEKRGPAHEAFLREYLDRSDDSLQTYYRALVFTGRGSMPKALGSDAEVVAYVARTRGAIGYIRTDTIAEGVKTLFVIAAGNAPRKIVTRVEPQYPETLRKLGIGGIVRLAVTISPKGNVESVALLGGNPILGESAVIAVKRWIYAVGSSRITLEVTIPFDPVP